MEKLKSHHTRHTGATAYSGLRMVQAFMVEAPGGTAHAYPLSSKGDLRSDVYAARPCSTAWARRKRVLSSKCLPSICNPIGRPDLVWPQGTLMPGMPTRSATTV